MRKLIQSWARKSLSFIRGDGSFAVSRLGGDASYLRYEARHADASSAVAACVGWAARAFLEPPLVVQQEERDGWRNVPGHPLIAAIHGPTFADGETNLNGRRLIQATLPDLLKRGNAYWHILRNASGRVIGFDYLLPGSVSPKCVTGFPQILGHYEVSRRSGMQRLEPSEVVHFAIGVDPDDVLLGLSPLESVMREVLTDNEAAVYSHAILRNMGVPAAKVSPKNSGDSITAEQAEALKSRFEAGFRGDSRGSLFVSSLPVEYERIGFSPADIDVRTMRRSPEERISAALGIPAVVAGLGAGLERSTFSNMAEAREAATEAFLVPMWRLFADTLTRALADQLGPNQRIAFDLSEVKALQEDEDARYKRIADAYRAGLIKRSEGKQKLGYDVGPEDEVYATDMTLGQVLDAGKRAAIADLKGQRNRFVDLHDDSGS